MQVLNLSLTFVFAIFGYVALVHTRELVETPLGRSLLALIVLFWLWRAIQQPLFLGLRHWGSVAFLLLFLLGSVLYAVPAAMAG